jgi:hypothetical protein
VYTPAPATPVAIPASGDADYRVGIEIQPGWYRTAGGDHCYWEMSTRHDGEVSGITLNHFGRGPQVVQLQATSPAFESRSCGTWTRLPGQPRPMVSVTSAPDDVLLHGLDATYTNDSGPIVLKNWLDGGVFVSVADSAGTNAGIWSGLTIVLTPPSGQQLVPGTYSNVVVPGVGLPGPGLQLANGDLGCNTVSGSFTIGAITWDASGNPTSLTAFFEQHCDGGPAEFGFIDI